MVRKIPPDAEPGILELAGKGKSLAEICNWLDQKHGVRVSPTAIRKRLAKVRSDRQVVAKAVVRDAIVKTVTTDLDYLDRERTRLATLATKLYKRAMGKRISRYAQRAPSELYCGVVDCLRKLIDTKLHYSGADAPDDPLAQLADAERRLTGRLDRLARTQGEGAAPEGARPHPAR